MPSGSVRAILPMRTRNGPARSRTGYSASEAEYNGLEWWEMLYARTNRDQLCNPRSLYIMKRENARLWLMFAAAEAGGFAQNRTFVSLIIPAIVA